MSLLRSIAVLFLCAVVCVPSSPAAFNNSDLNKGDKDDRPLKILHITPTGSDVPTGRQIVFQFNRPVVPVGRMERRPDEIPITIEPQTDCEWHWLNTSSLACQLSTKATLSPATRYRIEVRPGISTQDGVTLSEALSHNFITQRPRVGRYPRFHTWRAPGLPRIIVQFDQDVYRESVVEHLLMQLENGKRIPLVVEEDPEVAAARGRLRDDSSNTGEQGREVVGVVTEGRQRLAFSGQLPGDQEKLRACE
ncbi:MAG: Ig-like domain-containing protein [Pseudomonadota bacterium]